MFDFLESSAEPIYFDFVDREIESTSLEKVVRAACTYSEPRATSWIRCVNDRRVIAALARAAHYHPYIQSAPVVFVYFDSNTLHSKATAKNLRLLEVNDVSASHQFASLAIKAAGMQCKMVNAFDEMIVREILRIPAEFTPRSMLSFGYYS